MKEIQDIIQAFDKAQQDKKQTALATVVHVEGSSYRRPGARMLVTEDGHLTGAISGGCLEGDALRKALLAMAQHKPMLVTYDTNDEDDSSFGMGLGCNGIIQVLIEPIDLLKENNPIVFLKAIAAKRQEVALITLFNLTDKKAMQPGTCMLLNADGIATGHAGALHNIVLQDAVSVLQQKQSAFKNYIEKDNSITAFIEILRPAVSMVVIGAGSDVFPLIQMATIIGWQTTVVDGRPAYAKPERFVPSCQVLLSKPENVLRQITTDSQTVFVLMTHNYNYDMAMLQLLLAVNVTYIGMLGPHKKRDRMLNELAQKGQAFNSQQLAVLHSPVGLDIGAETPEEIALSVIAEIKAVLAGKKGISLTNNTAVIHDRQALKIEDVTLS